MTRDIRIGFAPEDAAIRANAFFALARAFDLPAKWPENFGDLLRASFSATDARAADHAAALADAVEAEADRESIMRAHSRLFLGPFTVSAPPWAAFYLDPEQKLLGPVSEYAARAYIEAGLAPSAERTEAPDHIAHELEFMYFLAFEEANSGDAVWRSRQARFWRDHLGPWLPRLARQIGTEAGDSRYYVVLAMLAATFSDWVGAQLGGPETQPAD